MSSPPAPGVAVLPGTASSPQAPAGGVPLFLTATPGGVPDGARLTSWRDVPAGVLRRSVRGFFDNGGQACHVAMVESWTPAECTRALDAAADVDEVDLVVAPELVTATTMTVNDVVAAQRAMLRHCHRHGGRFALLDTAMLTGAGSHVDTVLAQRNGLRGPDHEAADAAAHGALLHPWLRVAEGPVPAGGHLAGVVARCEQAEGPHGSPANEPIEGVLGLVDGPSEPELATLVRADVDCVRALPARRLRLWGSRALDGGHLTARRVLIAVRRRARALFEEMLFEPHDDGLRRRVVRELDEYLAGLLARGALRGADRREAFTVRCDAATTPPERAALGVLVVEVGLALARPAAFVTVRLVLDPTGTVSTA